jgi:hypothetical protein
MQFKNFPFQICAMHNMCLYPDIMGFQSPHMSIYQWVRFLILFSDFPENFTWDIEFSHMPQTGNTTPHWEFFLHTLPKAFHNKFVFVRYMYSYFLGSTVQIVNMLPVNVTACDDVCDDMYPRYNFRAVRMKLFLSFPQLNTVGSVHAWLYLATEILFHSYYSFSCTFDFY